MNARFLAGYAMAGLLVVGFCCQAQAQRPTHYYPARPTFSPYLLYGQLNTTGVPNYYSYVRPSVQFRDYLQRPAPQGDPRTQVLTQDRLETALENQLRQRPTTGIGQPNVPARFMESSHFYPQPTYRR